MPHFISEQRSKTVKSRLHLLELALQCLFVLARHRFET